MREPVKTFSIGFEGDAAYDETAVARDVAERFETDHTEFRVPPSAVDLIDTLLWHHDGPFGDSSAIPTYLVSQLTRQHVTVVLTGDGGDEVFAGYLRFRAALAAERAAARWPASRCRRCSRAAAGAAQRAALLSRARRFARLMHLPLLERLRTLEQFLSRTIWRRCCAGLAAPGSIDPLAASATALDELARLSPLGQLLVANFALVPAGRSARQDRPLTMANSIEARAPFLDRALIEYAASLPDDFKLRGGPPRPSCATRSPM